MQNALKAGSKVLFDDIFFSLYNCLCVSCISFRELTGLRKLNKSSTIWVFGSLLKE